MTNIPIMAFAGYSGSGKTTLLEKLIREIKSRGVRLAVIKHDGHQFEIDHEGKDLPELPPVEQSPRTLSRPELLNAPAD